MEKKIKLTDGTTWNRTDLASEISRQCGVTIQAAHNRIGRTINAKKLFAAKSTRQAQKRTWQKDMDTSRKHRLSVRGDSSASRIKNYNTFRPPEDT